MTAKRRHLTSQKFTLTVFCRLSVLALTVTAELPSLSRLKPTMTAVLPSPLRGITGDANFVQAIYENGITYDAIAQVWGRAKRNCEKMFSAHLFRKKPTPPASHAPGVAELSLSTGIASIGFMPPRGQNPFPGDTPEYPLPRRKSNRMEELF